MKPVALILIVAMLQGCALMDFFKPSGKPLVDAEVVVGDKNQQVATGAVVGQKETTHNTADTITQTYHTINKGKSISDIVFMMFMSFLVGWLAMPSTRQMILMIKKFFRRKTPTV